VTKIVKQVIDSLGGSPFILALLVVNVISLAGFGYVLHEVSAAMARREAILARCLDR